MKPTFVYCPSSGPRWIDGAEPRPGLGLPVVVWPNRSAHVVGLTISVSAAEPGRYWRPEACEVATTAARALDSVAWDDQGTVSIAIPWLAIVDHTRYVAGEILRAMWAVRAAATGIAADPGASAVAAAPSEDMVAAATVAGPRHTAWHAIQAMPRSMRDPGIDELLDWGARVEPGEGRTVVGLRPAGRHSETAISAPWGEPEVYGAALEGRVAAIDEATA